MNFAAQHVITNILEKQWNFGTCVQEHSDSDEMSPVYNHLLECEHFNYVANLHSFHAVTISQNNLCMLNLLNMTIPKLLTTVKIVLNCVF